MIKNIIFDFDGVIVDSEVIVAKSVCKYLLDRGISFGEKDFFRLAGNKTVQIISDLSAKFKIQDEEKFYNDIINISHDLYNNKLEAISGIENFLKKTNHTRLIGSNNIKDRIIKGLQAIKLEKFFSNNLIFSFDMIGIPKPSPDIYLKAIEIGKINKSETIIIEDSLIGTKAGVSAGIKVIGLTAGGHWYNGRSNNELYEAGAYEVVNNYHDMLLLIDKL